MSRLQKNSWVFVLALCFASCNVVKHLGPDETLYTGATVHVDSEWKSDEKLLRKELQDALMPKPNKKLLGIRFRLGFYYAGGEEPEKGFKRWLKNKAGEPPVLFDPNMPAHVSDVLLSRMHNMGFFDAAVNYEVHNNDKKTSVSYTATATRPYRIARLFFPEGGSAVENAVAQTANKSLLKPGRRYDLDVLKDERIRIDAELKNNGFYFFNPDYLLYRADTTFGNKGVVIRVEIKPDAPARALVPYSIKNIFVHTAHSLRDSVRRRRQTDTIPVNGMHYITRDSAFRPSTIVSAIRLKPGETYSRKEHSATLSRLMSMGVFHYVNVRFSDSLAGDTGFLDAHVYLSPTKKRTLQLELQAVTKSNNYSGPALNASYKNRNVFRGAELLIFNLNTNYETQFTGIQKGFNSWEIGGNTQLFFPRFLVPFRLTNVSSTYIPKTRIEAGFRNMNRMLYFSMNAVNFSFGYIWRESAEKEHDFNPFAVNFAKVMRSTTEFEELLRINPFLRRTFEQQFTIGSNYAFTYNGLQNGARRDQYYFNGMIDLSGNALNLIHRLLYNRAASVEQPFYLFNFRYAQYTKFSADGRYYRVINRNNKIATRLVAGVGIPYGNSRSLPFIKQFFSGGANSIRAFLPRTVGPGVFVSADSASRRSFLDQAGDLKLEGNVEYRFTIVGLLKGALFLDAGNVWLFRENDLLPGGKFDPRTFYRQLAVGTGFGLRIDVDYFVLRFDLGMPLRKPFIAENHGWVYRDIDFSSRAWRRQNLVLNIAIGYPF